MPPALRIHALRRCPKCGEVTDQATHCFVKGPPLFPQLDDYTSTVPCDVVALEDLRAAAVSEWIELIEQRGLDESAVIEVLNTVLVWVKAAPDSSHGGPTTGLTWQRGRVIATWTHDGTVGMSTYPSAEDAAQKAGEMERAYRNWLTLRDARREDGE